jgi:D-alanyl-D-alanine endopeptidase (penicillin-binding protein 7)
VHGKRKVSYQHVSFATRVPAGPPTVGDLAGLNLVRDPLDLQSNVALVLDENSSEVLFEKNASVALPIASITKLMTGLIVVEARQDMDEVLTVTDEDVDREKHSSSRLKPGSRLTRSNMLHIALMSSENRAASALGRNYPGGLPAFVEAMNAKAAELGMTDTHYVDSNGLSSRNVASARDLAKLAMVAHQQPLLRQYTTDPNYVVASSGRAMAFSNTNHFVANPNWEIGLQKTGFINEAGRCMVMQAIIQGRAVIMVFLDSKGKQARTSDVGRMRKWLESSQPTSTPTL